MTGFLSAFAGKTEDLIFLNYIPHEQLPYGYYLYIPTNDKNISRKNNREVQKVKRN